MAHITQPLMAVGKKTKAGYKFIFDEQGSRALNKTTQEWIPIDKEEDARLLGANVHQQRRRTHRRRPLCLVEVNDGLGAEELDVCDGRRCGRHEAVHE